MPADAGKGSVKVARSDALHRGGVVVNKGGLRTKTHCHSKKKKMVVQLQKGLMTVKAKENNRRFKIIYFYTKDS